MSDHGGVRFVDRLRPILAAGDLAAARALLDGLDGDDLAEAKSWFAANARWFRQMHEHVEFVGVDSDERYEARHRTTWIIGLCAVALCGPRTAADRIVWGQGRNAGEAALVRALCDKPEAWAAEFVDAASTLRIASRAPHGDRELSAAVRAVVLHHGFPCPTGETFAMKWLAGTPVDRWDRTVDDLVRWLPDDPLMPDILLRLLESGECSEYPEVVDIVRPLVEQGVVERVEIIDVALTQLTTGQRPTSQRVLAKVLGALEVRPEEVTGGLDYLLGVVSTSDRGVQPVLVPLAIELADTTDQWIALVGVIAGRPEKWAKEQLLAALKKPGAVARLGGTNVGTLLDSLAAGDDAAFTAKVAKVRASLAPTAVSDVDEQRPPLGLWDLDPVRIPPTGYPAGYENYVVPHRYRRKWSQVLDKTYLGYKKERPLLVEYTISDMVEGTYDETELVAAVRMLVANHRLSCAALTASLEDIFLAGGLRRSWDTALRVADLTIDVPRRPTGIADLLRMLARYAGEVPGPQAPSIALSGIAAETSETKAVMEARRLVAAMSGKPWAAAGETTAQRDVLGLWGLMTDETNPLPSDIPIGDDPILARAETLPALRALLEEHEFGYGDQWLYDVCWPPSQFRDGTKPRLTSRTEPDRVLAAVVAAAHRFGSTVTRSSLCGIERGYADPLDIVLAVDLWAEGLIDVAAFWRIGAGPTISSRALQERWHAEGAPWPEVFERAKSLLPFRDGLRLPADPEVGVFVVAPQLAAPLDRFTFLRAAEALLRAEAEPELLCLPTWHDGTLGIDDLIGRLRKIAAGTGVVGPIDLVQALHRLRPADARWIDDVPAGLTTDARFTDPSGLETWDATALIQKWIGEGGLPALAPVARDGYWVDPPTTPVPFGRLAAWPAELAHDPWNPGPMPSTLRLFPRWTDRLFERAFAWDNYPGRFPTMAPGPLGLPFHDRVVAELGRGTSTQVVQLTRWHRLDLDLIAQAAVERHEAGTLSLTQLTKTLQGGLETALRGLWPLALVIADALCAVPRRPPQLADLLRVLVAFVHEVPASAVQEIPTGLASFAESRGSTKAHLAARGLVAGLERARAA